MDASGSECADSQRSAADEDEFGFVAVAGAESIMVGSVVLDGSLWTGRKGDLVTDEILVAGTCTIVT